MHTDLSATILVAIRGMAEGRTGSPFEAAARKYNALPLYAGWCGWGLLTPQGDVLEADEEEGGVALANEPWRTLYLVVGAERFPEIASLLPQRPADATACSECMGTGWVHVEGCRTQFPCGPCRALGWLAPSNKTMEPTR